MTYTVPLAGSLRDIPAAEADAIHLNYRILGATAVDTDEYIAQALIYQYQLVPQDQRVDIFTAFAEIAKHRNTTDLQIYVALAHSDGVYTRQELDEAFEILGIPSRAEQAHIGDTEIAEAYNAQLALGPLDFRRRQLRDAMRIMQKQFDSQLIEAVLMSTDVQPPIIASIKEAYEALSMSETDGKGAPDDMILAVYEAVMGESVVNVTKTKLALEMIAKDRNSATLQSFVDSGTKRASDHGPSPDAHSFDRVRGEACRV